MLSENSSHLVVGPLTSGFGGDRYNTIDEIAQLQVA